MTSAAQLVNPSNITRPRFTPVIGGVTLDKAHKQWASRPVDERFSSFESLHAAVKARKEASVQKEVRSSDLRAEPHSEHGIVLRGPAGGIVSLSNWSFRQTTSLVGAPSDFIADCVNRQDPSENDPELAARVLNRKFQQSDRELNALVLRTDSGVPQLRAMNSPSYARIWDAWSLDLIADLIEGADWKLPLGYKDGKWNAELVPSGAYTGDRSTFLFMINESSTVEVLGRKLSRGFFFWNSEVGSQTIGMDMFLYDHVCGNNYVWGAHMIAEIRRRHIGAMLQDRATKDISKMLTTYSNASTENEVKAITKASELIIEKPVEFLRSNDFAKFEATEAIEAAKREEGDAKTLWQLVMGATAYARSLPNRDARVDLDRRAGKLLALAN